MEFTSFHSRLFIVSSKPATVFNPLLPEDHFCGLQLAVGDNQKSSHSLEIHIIM